MTTYFVDSNAVGANNGTSKTDAWTSIYSADSTATAGGDIVKVSHLHVEASATAALSFAFDDEPVYLVAWDFTGDTPIDTKATRAGTYPEITAYGWAGNVLVRGMRIKVTVAHQFNATTDCVTVVENCYLWSTKTSGDILRMGSNSSSAKQHVIWRNTDLETTDIGVKLEFGYGVRFDWEGGDFVSVNTPTALMRCYAANAIGPKVNIFGIDFTGSGWSGKGVFASIATDGPLDINFSNCKLGAGANFYSGAVLSRGGRIRVNNCKIGTVKYAFIERSITGIVESVTDVADTGSDGTTSSSLKVSPESKCTYGTPIALPTMYSKFNSSLTSQQVTIQIGGDAGTLTDKQVWMDVWYPDADGVYQLVAYDGASIGPKRGSETETGNNIATSTAAWATNSGPSVVTKQKLVSPSFTPGSIGPIRVNVYVGDSAITALWVSQDVGLA